MLLLLSSCSVMSNSLRPHGCQHTWLPCPSQSLRVCSCPLSPWCHPTISFSVTPFSSFPQSFLASGSFPVNQLFPSSDSSHQVALRISSKYWSFSINPSSEYSGLISFMIDWFDLLAIHGTLKSLLQHHSSKTSILPCHNSKF